MKNLRQLLFFILFLGISNDSLGQRYSVPELIPYRKGDKWGYVDKDKNVKIPIMFESARPFEKHYAYITKSGKWGTINKKGNYIIKPEYEYLTFSEDLAVVQDTATKLYGFINERGMWVIEPKFWGAGHFQNGFANVWLNKHEWVFIDIKGNQISIPRKERPEYFILGYALLNNRNYSPKGGYQDTFGLANKYGELILPLEYQRINIITKNFIQIVKDDKVGFVDSLGKEILPLIYDNSGGNYTNQSSEFKDGYAVIGKNRKYGIVDSTGNIVVELKYSEIRMVGEGIAAIVDSTDKSQLNFYIHFINMKDELVIPTEKYAGMPVNYTNGYCRIIEFPHELVQEANSFFTTVSYMNKKGKRITKDIYVKGGNFNEGLAMVANQKNKIGFIDTTGTIVINFQYDYDYSQSYGRLHNFENELCLVSKNGIFFYIDRNGVEYYQPSKNSTEKAPSKANIQKNVPKTEKCSDIIYSITEEVPLYKSGQSDLKNYFKSNIDIPSNYKASEIKIPFEFIVDCDGKATQPYFNSIKYSDLNRNIEIAILNMDKWKPAKMNGKAVKYKLKYVLIISNETVDIKQNK